MKKSKLSIGLVTSFIGALALTSCSTEAVTESKTSIVDIIGYNDDKEKIEINIDELYRKYGESSEGTTLYYNAILEALIRYEYPELSKDPDLKNIEILESEAEDKLKAVQQTAKDNAKSNGTDYEDEWEKILESNDVETNKELKNKYLYELEKEAITDWYYKKNTDSLKDEFIGVTSDWKEVEEKVDNVDSVYPYHILHVLVKLDGADATDYARATITEAQANKLWEVVRQLIDGNYDFQDVAYNLSDDTSNTAYGDVGIMSTKTSFYNEFKLGIYAYDAILSGVNSKTANNGSIYEAFGLNGQVVDSVTQATGEVKEDVSDLVVSRMVTDNQVALVKNATDGITTIPFDVFRRIGEAADETKIGTFTPEAGDVVLPRNVLFNQFLNFRSPFVITNEVINENSVSATNDKATVTAYDFNDPAILKLKSNNFKTGKVDSLAADRGVLCDKQGNVVIGVRSEAGIHFMVMRKSVFENTNAKVGKQGTSLQEYFTTKIPGEEGYPTGKETYVNMQVQNDQSYYTNRANTIKNEIKSTDTFDAAYDYRIYEALLENELVKGKIHFSDEDENGNSQIAKNIEAKISLLRESSHINGVKSINDAWANYLAMLRYQNTVRSDAGQFKGALVHTTCAFKFNKDNKALFEEDGLCYVK